MNNTDIDTFLAIVRTGTLSGASERLFISQSAVTQRLHSLENELGYSLFDRHAGNKRMTLTAKGYEFFPLAQQLSGTYEEMKALASNELTESLYIGGISTVNFPLLTDFFLKLSNGYYGQKFNLRVRTNWSNELYELLDRKIIDCAIVAEKYAYTSIELSNLFTEDLFIVMPKGNAFYDKKIIDAKDLDPSNEIFFSWSYDFKLWHNKMWHSTNKHAIYIDEITFLPEFMFDSGKWAFISESTIPFILKKGDFQFFRISNPPPKRTIYFATNQLAASAVKKKADFIHECLKDYIRSNLEFVSKSNNL